MKAEQLAVVTAYSNPLRWQSRRRLYEAFKEHMLESGVRLTTVECAYGEREHELADPRINHVAVRARTMAWSKECLLNIGIARTSSDYIGFFDADVFFRKKGWAAEAVEALQHYHVIQPWSDAYDLGPNDEHIQHHRSFMRQWWSGEPVVPDRGNMWNFQGGPYWYPHSGFAWCATRQALDWLGGLFEVAGMGAGDHHMALGLAGMIEKSVPEQTSESYLRHLRIWQDRAVRHINFSLGFTWGTIEHRFHGSKVKRKYVDRWGMFSRHGFDPDLDLKRNASGVIEFTGAKPELILEWDRYLRSRDEDSNSLS